MPVNLITRGAAAQANPNPLNAWSADGIWKGQHHSIQWRLTQQNRSDRQLLHDLAKRF